MRLACLEVPELAPNVHTLTLSLRGGAPVVATELHVPGRERVALTLRHFICFTRHGHVSHKRESAHLC